MRRDYHIEYVRCQEMSNVECRVLDSVTLGLGNPNDPTQIHLAYTGNSEEMR